MRSSKSRRGVFCASAVVDALFFIYFPIKRWDAEDFGLWHLAFSM